jgi:hypothetical protein
MKASKKQRIFMIAAGLFIGGITLTVFILRLRGHWEGVGSAFRRASYLWLVPSLAAIVMVYSCRIWRWKILLSASYEVSWGGAASSTLIAFMANTILPARLGEMIRPYILKRRENVPYSYGLATVGLSRIFDLIGLAFMITVASFLLLNMQPPDDVYLENTTAAVQQQDMQGTGDAATAVPGGDAAAEEVDAGKFIASLKRGAAGMFGAGIVIIAVLLFMAFFPSKFLKVAKFGVSFLPHGLRGPVEGFVASFAEATGVLKNWRSVGYALILTLGLWLSTVLNAWLVARTMQIDLGVAGAFLVVVAMCLAVALPQAPAYMGAYQLSIALAAEFMGVGRAEAGAFSMLMWVTGMVPVTLAGLFCWFGETVRGREE